MESLDEQLIREAIEAWNRGEWDAALERVDPDVEWRGATELLDLPKVSYGRDGVREFWRLWTESWDGHPRGAREEHRGGGRHARPGPLAGPQPRRARGGPAGRVPLEIRDHMVTRFVSYWERSQAFEALGLPTPG